MTSAGVIFGTSCKNCHRFEATRTRCEAGMTDVSGSGAELLRMATLNLQLATVFLLLALWVHVLFPHFDAS